MSLKYEVALNVATPESDVHSFCWSRKRFCLTPREVLLVFFFITLKPRVEWYTKSMSLRYEPASEPLHISVK